MNYSKINDYLLNNDIFDTLELIVSILSTIDPKERIKKKKLYIINGISIKNNGNFNIENIEKFITDINENIKKGGYRKESNNTGWTLFYLFKELISYFQNNGFNYFRGQRSDWETIPSIFRSFKNKNGDMYYENFEKIYSTIQKKFPDKIKYISLLEDNININEVKEKIDDRSKQLALLQHYGIKTSLLDITSNPYIAMLFMINGELKNNFQLELYSIKDDNPLFSDVEFSSFNKRITAQKGAFLNYDALISQDIQNQISNDKIKRIKININYSSNETKYQFEKVRDKIIELKTSKYEEYDEEQINKLDKIISGIDNFDYESEKNDRLLELQKHLKKKLKEFGYEEFELFPDFEDYLKYTMDLYNIRDNN